MGYCKLAFEYCFRLPNAIVTQLRQSLSNSNISKCTGVYSLQRYMTISREHLCDRARGKIHQKKNEFHVTGQAANIGT